MYDLSGSDEILISENSPVDFILPISITVSDLDDQENGRVMCTVEPSRFFSISDCESIKLERELDFEKQQLVMITLSARDEGKPPRAR